MLFVRLLADGGRLAYEPSAVVRHVHRREISELRGQLWGYGVGFSAMLTATVLTATVAHRPRLLLALVGQVCRAGAQRIFGTKAKDGPNAANRMPRYLSLIRFAGMAFGPFAYVHGARKLRRWRR